MMESPSSHHTSSNANLKSRMDSLAAVGGRRLNAPKAYLFIFGLILAAVLSIYKSSGGTTSTTVDSKMELSRSGMLFSPTRLDDRVDVESDEENGKENDKPVKVDQPMNIVILYADDMRHDSIGVAGTQPVETPFLDWLSNTKAMRFTHNAVSTSVCWISRATLHSGVYFSRHQALRPRDSNWYEDYWETSYPSILKKLGYYVAHIGKEGLTHCAAVLYR